MMNPIAGTWNQCLEYAALSDVGLRRANNQDSFAITLANNQDDFECRGHFFMVADGMGAHAAGELASKMATDAVAMGYRKRLDQPPAEALLSAVLDANHQIHTRGQASPDFRGMGTTATSLVLLPAGALVAHVGDSRAYRVRGTQVDQLTFDHSLVWEIRAANQASGMQLPGYISKNIITRSLGPNPAVQVDLEGPFPLQVGDSFLLCSDGLSNQVKDEEIGMILSCLPPDEAVRSLMDLALLRGGPDNITVVVAKVLGPQIAPATDSTSSSRRLQPVPPAALTILVLGMLLGFAMVTLGAIPWAMAAFAAAAIASLWAIIQRYGKSNIYDDNEEQRFGRGPYVTCDGKPTSDLLTQLADIAGQLRDAGVEDHWPVDWTAFDRHLVDAERDIQSQKPADAARHFLRAISNILIDRRRVQEQEEN
jgi:protein phosphatase